MTPADELLAAADKLEALRAAVKDNPLSYQALDAGAELQRAVFAASEHLPGLLRHRGQGWAQLAVKVQEYFTEDDELYAIARAVNGGGS